MTLKDAIEQTDRMIASFKKVSGQDMPKAITMVLDAARDMLALGEKEKKIPPTTRVPNLEPEFEDFIVTAANLAQKWGGDV